MTNNERHDAIDRAFTYDRASHDAHCAHTHDDTYYNDFMHVSTHHVCISCDMSCHNVAHVHIDTCEHDDETTYCLRCAIDIRDHYEMYDLYASYDDVFTMINACISHVINDASRTNAK